MNPTDLLRQRHKFKNQEEYQVKYNYLRFISEEEAIAANDERNVLLNRLRATTKTGFKGTKLDISVLSPGCKICGEGTWSCLFINGVCNCRCFYCPAPQHEVHEPETNTLLFPEPEDYIDYLKTFDFRGMSISGGEPLLTLEKTLKFIRMARKEIGDGLYIWLYSNGRLFDREKAHMLRDAGINEIRFDIGATDYNTNKIAQAVGIIPNVTVEIPAIPEDFEVMKQKMKELKNIGVDFLNLHQLRLTPFNFNRMIDHDYTYLHGEKVTVLESELTALKLILFTKEAKIDLPVNYCSYIYKNRYQKSAARRRHALKMLNPGESITESGFIRRMSFLPDHPDDTNHLLKEKGLSLDEQSAEWLFQPKDYTRIRPIPGKVKIEYYVARLAPKPTDVSEFTLVILNENRDIVIERSLAQPETILEPTEAESFFKYLEGVDFFVLTDERKWSSIMRFENIGEGLQSFY